MRLAMKGAGGYLGYLPNRVAIVLSGGRNERKRGKEQSQSSISAHAACRSARASLGQPQEVRDSRRERGGSRKKGIMEETLSSCDLNHVAVQFSPYARPARSIQTAESQLRGACEPAMLCKWRSCSSRV